MARYLTGETVQDGDEVRTPRGRAIIVRVLEPGTREAIDYSCPSGGLLYLEEYQGRYGLNAIESLDASDWEMEFVSRGEVPKEWARGT